MKIKTDYIWIKNPKLFSTKNGKAYWMFYFKIDQPNIYITGKTWINCELADKQQLKNVEGKLTGRKWKGKTYYELIVTNYDRPSTVPNKADLPDEMLDALYSNQNDAMEEKDKGGEN